MVNINIRFVVLVSHAIPSEANTSKFFAAFDGLVVLISCSDAEMSRSGDFCVDDKQNRSLYPSHMSI